MTEETTITQAELDEIKSNAQYILNWKADHGWTFAKLRNKFPRIGSDRTLSRLAKGEFAEIDIVKWSREYRLIVASMITYDETASKDRGILNLSNVEKVTRAVAEAVPRDDIDRFILIEGPSGSGKTTTLKAICAEYPGLAVAVEATDTWRSARNAAGDILLALGEGPESIKYSYALRLQAIKDKLSRRRILCIDEGHHAGPEFLSLIKTLLNQTPVVIVLACVDTLWSKLARASAEEARQLLHNRLAERVRLVPPSDADVRLYFSDLGEISPKLADAISDEAARLGRVSFLRRVHRSAKDLLASNRSADLSDILVSAVTYSKADMGDN